jgi:hypothetical protein
MGIVVRAPGARRLPADEQPGLGSSFVPFVLRDAAG